MKKILSKLSSFLKSGLFAITYKRPIVAFFVTLGLSLSVLGGVTLARYISTVNAPFNDNGDIKDGMDFTVNTVFVVNDQNDLFAAINQGYSYIQIAGELTNPLVITQSPKNLKTDLILDLNGIELYRHGTEPIFEISEGVRLTITDTSESQRGCLYNPTGSVLKIDGGALTVVSGKFECGPRYSEYYTYNNNILSEKSKKRTIVEPVSYPVTFYSKNYDGDGIEINDTFTEEVRNAPIIKAYDTSFDGMIHHHGNVYCDWNVKPDDASFGIKADTYCYYTTNEDESYEIMKSTAYRADWYYTYFVDHETYTYEASPDEDSIEVTIYGYENVIKRAEEKDDPSNIDSEKNNFFAAIKMSGGVFDILYGDFYNYFGVNTTACIDMMGGELTIKEGNFSTRIPNASSHSHHMVDAKEDDAAAFDPFDYFNDFHWGKENFGPSDPEYDTYKDGIRAHKGEGFGILTSGDAKITIGKGNFYSSNNNLIHMQKGKLDIGGGTFYKTNTILLTEYKHEDTAIYMHDGELNITDAEYIIYGDYIRMIQMIDGKLNMNGAKCTVHGDYSYAVYSTIPGDNSLQLTDIKFDIYARTEAGRTIGIYSGKSALGERGRVNINTSEGGTSYINIQGQGSVGIYSNGGDVKSQGCAYTIEGYSSAGIYADGGYVVLNGGAIDVKSNVNCYGIYAISKEEDTEVNVELTNVHIDVGYVNSEIPPTTVHSDCKACIGVFLGSANENSTVTLTNSNVHSYEVGLALSGGHLVVRDNDSTPNNIKTNRASAIAVSGGDLRFEEGGQYDIISFNTTSGDCQNSYNMTVPFLTKQNGAYVITEVEYRNTDGVYINGGSFHSNGEVNIIHTGLQNETDYGVTYVYNTLVVTSYAVRVVGGEVVITRANIVNKSGGGICCSGTDEKIGKITLGNENTQLGDITVLAEGEEYATENEGIYHSIGEYISDGWRNRKSITGGHAIELNGGDIIVYGGSYTANFGNGIYARSNGIITVYDGSFDGKMTTGTYREGQFFYRHSGPAAYYGLKVIGGATVNIYDGNFNGGNGGAFVTGIDRYVSTYDYGSTTGNMANVFVYGGTFGNGVNLDSFNVYDYSNVVFGAAGAGAYPNAASYKSAIMMLAGNATIATNKLTQGKGTSSLAKTSVITIYYGSYGNTGNSGNGIWNENATITIYNDRLGYVTYGDKGGGAQQNVVGNNEPEYYQ